MGYGKSSLMDRWLAGQWWLGSWFNPWWFSINYWWCTHGVIVGQMPIEHGWLLVTAAWLCHTHCCCLNFNLSRYFGWSFWLIRCDSFVVVPEAIIHYCFRKLQATADLGLVVSLFVITVGWSFVCKILWSYLLIACWWYSHDCWL